MICSSEKRFFTSNLLRLGDWTPNGRATQSRGDVGPEVLTRLIRAVAIQCVSEIPSILATTRNELGLHALKDSVVQLSSLYKETVDFEVQSRSTHPPERLSEVHEMTYEWSRPIRLGVQEFIGVLKSLSEISAKDLKAKTVTPPNFAIKFAPPPNIDEFVRRLGLVDLSSNA